MSTPRHLTNKQKRRIYEELTTLRVKLLWSAQHSDETLGKFNARIIRYLERYSFLGKIAQEEFIEVFQTPEQRERLAIYTYLRGLRPEVKRYICNDEIYKSLEHAMKHASQIDLHLRDLQNLNSRTSILVVEDK